MSKMSIYAEVLIDNANYAKERVTAKTVGVSEFRAWSTAVKALRMSAYAVRVYRHNNMGASTVATPCDLSPFYADLRKVVDMIGEVNGAKLFPENIAEEILAEAMVEKAIDISDEMAHAHAMRNAARKTFNENPTEANENTYEQWKDECTRLEHLPGNQKNLASPRPEGAFMKQVEIKLTQAITKQSAKSVEEVLAEVKAKADARKAKAKERQKARREAKKAEEQVKTVA